MKPLIAALLTLTVFAGAARASDTGLEYRLKTKDGVPFAFDHAEEQYFSALPFMTAKDFTGAKARPSKNPNQPGGWEVVLTHTATGRAKLRAVADSNRAREFCIIFHGRLYQCEAFPPVMKAVFDKERVISDRLTRQSASELARAMAQDIRRARASKQP